MEMIISKTQVQNLLKVYEKNIITQPTAKIEKVGSIMKKDEVSISDDSKLRQRIIQAMSQADEIRQVKVEELQKQYAEGNYKVDSDQVAEKILQRVIIDELI